MQVTDSKYMKAINKIALVSSFWESKCQEGKNFDEDVVNGLSLLTYKFLEETAMFIAKQTKVMDLEFSHMSRAVSINTTNKSVEMNSIESVSFYGYQVNFNQSEDDFYKDLESFNISIECKEAVENLYKLVFLLKDKVKCLYGKQQLMLNIGCFVEIKGNSLYPYGTIDSKKVSGSFVTKVPLLDLIEKDYEMIFR